MDTKRQQSGNQPDTAKTSKPEPPAVDEVPALQSILACEGEEPKAEAKPEAVPEAMPAPEPTPAPTRKPRGFAAMDRATVRELARRGARASQARGTAHRFTSDEARAAGRKGGSAPHRIRGRGKSERPSA